MNCQPEGSHKDQATRLRELTRQRRRPGMTLAVTSGKGGVGKSNLAVNLSICMAAQGLRVTLVDVDMGLANADLLLNVNPRYNLTHVVTGVRTMAQISVAAPGGIHFVPGSSGRQELANLSDFERQNLILQLRTLQNSTDIVVLDCGAGISRNVVSFALAADHVMVVTTPQPTALTDAYAMIKILHRTHGRGRIGLVVNMAGSRAEAEGAYQRIAQVADRFLHYTVASDGYMLHDTRVDQAVRERCPFVIRYPESDASACVAAMATEVTRPCHPRARRGGLMRRVAGLFV